ncbi:MAG TPA: hypothetical protein VFM44_10435 [Gemmatimonadota bacterium]|jgi:hypothetical protein|nr:hypothetical protein [Gemmatimonadota bacterium]
MTTAGWVTMVIMCAYLWGGLIVLVWVAMRKERFKVEPPDRPWEP